MATRPVVPFGHPTLRKVAIPVATIDEVVRLFCVDLVDTMESAGAAGIAAPQLGSSLRVFAVATRASGAAEPMLFINPEILESSDMGPVVEGCLSFPGIYVATQLPTYIRIKFQTWDGSEQTIEARGDYAQVISHEYEHLDGKLLIDRAGPVKREMITRRMKKYRGKLLDYRTPANVENAA